jgi:hypothetical protein
MCRKIGMPGRRAAFGIAALTDGCLLLCYGGMPGDRSVHLRRLRRLPHLLTRPCRRRRAAWLLWPALEQGKNIHRAPSRRVMPCGRRVHDIS